MQIRESAEKKYISCVDGDAFSIEWLVIPEIISDKEVDWPFISDRLNE